VLLAGAIDDKDASPSLIAEGSGVKIEMPSGDSRAARVPMLEREEYNNRVCFRDQQQTIQVKGFDNQR
jgi:hypothetical protein